MKRNDDDPPGPPHRPPTVDPTTDVRIFAAWFGLVLVAMGVAMAGYLFFQIGRVIMDPRAFETQVDRWEFVLRGRATDAFPDTYETPELQRISANPTAPSGNGVDSTSGLTSVSADPVEETARLLGRIGSKSARLGALMLLMLVLLILVRIIFAVVQAGIRLAALAGGEREYMKRIIEELVDQRERDK